MFFIKICGITRPANALAAVEAGASAIGLNFFEGSPRRVSLESAAAIASELPGRVAKVGVFVNATADEIRQIAADVPLDWIQLHGDEPPEFTSTLRSKIRRIKIIKAFRLGSEGSEPIAAYMDQCRTAAVSPDAILIDAQRPGQYGGTGHTVDWSALAPPRDWARQTPLILAGGLDPQNVAEAIAACRPAAVDTASGVEFAPGKKDVMLLKSFIANAHAALKDATDQGA